MNEPDSQPSSSDLRGAAQETYDSVKERAAGALQDTGECARAHVYSVALVALVVGFLLGLMCRRKEATLQEKYLEAPLNDLRKAITSLSGVAAKKAAGGGEVAADMIESLSDKIRSLVKSL